MKRLILFVLLLTMVASNAIAGGLPKLRVGYIPEPAHGLYFVANEKGYFKEEGVDVELFQFGSAAEGLAALKAEKLDVGTFGTTAPILFISKGSEFTFIGGMMIGGQAIITRPERLAELSGKNLKVYKGKKIGLVKLSTGDVIFKGALKKAGIDYKKDITFVELGTVASVVEAVKKGAVDAGLVYPPHFSLAEKNYGLKVAHYIEDFYPDYTCCRIVAHTKQVNADPETYRKFLAALIRAYRFYKTNPAETVKIYAKALKIDEDIIRNETYVKKVADSNPDPLRKGILDFWQHIRDAGYIAQDYPLDKHINTTIYKQALDGVIRKSPKDKIYKQMLTFYKRNN
ncbi:ABC transporter, periplasmic substrate-binding protein, NMT1/THI5-like domain-containing [Geotalea daltonii FRC-32]|uniref:ABC transporter, periplasmic substrate-binding protein, NMT1/THI5-like domain-containing n=1 Tax=Geotalea daltonii (strain DSM 22248 / JCM 15807 / FRC-32) TaxID=316067 RepID=B9M0A4_GEODF|nr:ABC transporter substrate-binding protein [Geotalea daltonii]ACM20884.1 ABC transporter, periplasmic substrate-binding protein, NMT1/THI5-like domain-containing [Geotalea daltonii FRC-32]